MVLCIAAITAYAWHEPPTSYPKPYGGTWLGYTLGTLSAVLVVWLMLLGVRKRSYRSSLGTVQGWTSAHVYLGSTLVVLATLHCAFEFGWNVHTLVYVLMLAVVTSGFFGLYAYIRYPALMSGNMSGETLNATALKIDDLDRRCRKLALDLPDDINAMVMRATRSKSRESKLGSGFRRMLAGTDARCPAREACSALLAYDSERLIPAQSNPFEQLLSEMTRKSALTDRIRADLRVRALLVFWLFFHVPLSFGLLAALIAHVVSVFYYW